MTTEYAPSAWGWVADQVEQYEASGGEQANTFMDTGLPIVVMTTTGCRTGSLRKVPLMRIEHEGAYALVASKGGGPTHPGWYHNLLADPHVQIQDGDTPRPYTVSEVVGEERSVWFERCVAAFPPYADYAKRAGAAGREIPVFVAVPES